MAVPEPMILRRLQTSRTGRARYRATISCLVFTAWLFGSSAAISGADIRHRWGETVFPDQPARIVSLSFTGIDTLLALKLVPIAYRAWYGGDEAGLWPWARAHMPAHMPTGTKVTVLRGEIDPEAVARLRPDFVEAMYSGLSRAQYAALSRVSAVLPPLDGQGDFSAAWDDMVRGVGAATGRTQAADQVIERLHARFQAIRDRHPDWAGKTAVIAQAHGPVIYNDTDPRMALMTRLGFRLPDAARKFSLGNFFFKLDPELTAPLEADVVLWLRFSADTEHRIDHPLTHTRRSAREGREIFLTPELSAALSYASPLSIPYALTHLEPLLEAVLTKRGTHP